MIGGMNERGWPCAFLGSRLVGVSLKDELR